MRPQGGQNLLKRPLQVSRIVANHGDPQHRLLPIIHEVYLSNGNIKGTAQFIFDALHDLPLVLERPALPQNEPDLECANVERIKHGDQWAVGSCQ